MALSKVTAPTSDFTGEVVGVAFTKSIATVDGSTGPGRRALAYFRRRGYRVEPVGGEPIEEPATSQPDGGVPAPKRSASKTDWVAYATEHGAEHGGLTTEVAEKMTRDELAEHYLGPKED